MPDQTQLTSIWDYLKKEGYRLPEELKSEFDRVERKVGPVLTKALCRREGATELLKLLPAVAGPDDVAIPDDQGGLWQECAFFYFRLNRWHEAQKVFSAMYDQMLEYQQRQNKQIHKGYALVRIGECHAFLNHPMVAKRYLMLTACEDAIRGKGQIDPEKTGIYFRLVWERGVSHQYLNDYARGVWEVYQRDSKEGFFPEAIMQQLDQDWMTEFPSEQEVGLYFVTIPYVKSLLTNLGSGQGKILERLAHYLVSMMPGCRALKRSKTHSTDYDVVGIPEGPALDFRSELGRYFLCECKDWNAKADFTTMAKFCRVLDATKCSFGILFSKEGITGERGTTDSKREQFRIFQQRGIVVVVVTQMDIEGIAKGANFITLLRKRYEEVRLDLLPDEP